MTISPSDVRNNFCVQKVPSGVAPWDFGQNNTSRSRRVAQKFNCSMYRPLREECKLEEYSGHLGRLPVGRVGLIRGFRVDMGAERVFL